jgi:hypothetical protein
MILLRNEGPALHEENTYSREIPVEDETRKSLSRLICSSEYFTREKRYLEWK